MWDVVIPLVSLFEIIKFFILFFLRGLPQDFIHIIFPMCTDIIFNYYFFIPYDLLFLFHIIY